MTNGYFIFILYCSYFYKFICCANVVFQAEIKIIKTLLLVLH